MNYEPQSKKIKKLKSNKVAPMTYNPKPKK